MMILARTELATIDALRASGEEPERILELIESIAVSYTHLHSPLM